MSKCNETECRLDILKMKIPDVSGTWQFYGGYHLLDRKSEIAKTLIFINDMKQISRDDLYDKMPNSWLGNLKYLDLIKWNMSDDTYSVNENGRDIIVLINWFTPVMDLVDFMINTEFSSADELDILLAMAGKHQLVEKDVISKVAVIYGGGDRLLNDASWTHHFLRDILWALNDQMPIVRDIAVKAGVKFDTLADKVHSLTVS